MKEIKKGTMLFSSPLTQNVLHDDLTAIPGGFAVFLGEDTLLIFENPLPSSQLAPRCTGHYVVEQTWHNSQQYVVTENNTYFAQYMNNPHLSLSSNMGYEEKKTEIMTTTSTSGEVKDFPIFQKITQALQPYADSLISLSTHFYKRDPSVEKAIRNPTDWPQLASAWRFLNCILPEFICVAKMVQQTVTQQKINLALNSFPTVLLSMIHEYLAVDFWTQCEAYQFKKPEALLQRQILAETKAKDSDPLSSTRAANHILRSLGFSEENLASLIFGDSRSPSTSSFEQQFSSMFKTYPFLFTKRYIYFIFAIPIPGQSFQHAVPVIIFSQRKEIHILDPKGNTLTITVNDRQTNTEELAYEMTVKALAPIVEFKDFVIIKKETGIKPIQSRNDNLHCGFYAVKLLVDSISRDNNPELHPEWLDYCSSRYFQSKNLYSLIRASTLAAAKYAEEEIANDKEPGKQSSNPGRRQIGIHTLFGSPPRSESSSSWELPSLR